LTRILPITKFLVLRARERGKKRHHVIDFRLHQYQRLHVLVEPRVSYSITLVIMVLDGGTIPTSPRNLHVHCAAEGLSPASETAIFSAGRFTRQSIRIGLLPFASALIAFVEATRDDLDAKNRLCPPNRQPNVPLDWLRGMLVGMKAARLWSKDPDIANWIERAGSTCCADCRSATVSRACRRRPRASPPT
jgi:hypothetical protein